MLFILSSNLSTFAWDALEDQRILKLVARDLPLCWSNTDEELKSIVIYLITYNQTRQMPPPGFSGQNLIYYSTQWNDSCHQSSSQRIKHALRLQVVAKARAWWKHYILLWTVLKRCSWKPIWDPEKCHVFSECKSRRAARRCRSSRSPARAVRAARAGTRSMCRANPGPPLARPRRGLRLPGTHRGPPGLTRDHRGSPGPAGAHRGPETRCSPRLCWVRAGPWCLQAPPEWAPARSARLAGPSSVSLVPLSYSQLRDNEGTKTDGKLLQLKQRALATTLCVSTVQQIDDAQLCWLGLG